MGNAAAENKRVKHAITDALFSLMEKKPFSEITVSDIVGTAGVARASFYRNYESREALIDEFVEDIHKKITRTHKPNLPDRNIRREDFVTHIEQTLTYVLTIRKPLLAMYNNGFVGYLQNIADIYMEEIAGDMLYSSANKYILYFLSGASMNMLIHWLQDGKPESAHELALACADYFLPLFQLRQNQD